MKITTLFVLPMLSVSCGMHNEGKMEEKVSSAQIDSAITRSIYTWTEAFTNKNYKEAAGLFDTAKSCMLIGSDSSEVCSGPAEIDTFLKTLFSLPLSFSWEIKSTVINHNENTAWAFVNATLFVTDSGRIMRIPYRFSVVATQQIKEWKWELYHGSEPKPQ